MSFDFCCLCQRTRPSRSPPWWQGSIGLVIPTPSRALVKSTKEEEYSDQIVHRCKMSVGFFGYKTVAMKSDQEEPMRALQQRVRKAVNCEMALTDSKKYDSKANGKLEKSIQESDRQVKTLKLLLENRIGKVVPPITL